MSVYKQSSHASPSTSSPGNPDAYSNPNNELKNAMNYKKTELLVALMCLIILMDPDYYAKSPKDSITGVCNV
jgi:hypothetical protein